MCLALYIGSESALPEIKYGDVSDDVFRSPRWPAVAQRFHVSALDEKQQGVRRHFSAPFVFFAGSYEKCSCGFNYGREHPEFEEDADHLRAARESVVALVTYVREHQVREVYACWSDEESLPPEAIRTVSLEELASPTFVFGRRELIRLAMPSDSAFQPPGADGLPPRRNRQAPWNEE